MRLVFFALTFLASCSKEKSQMSVAIEDQVVDLVEFDSLGMTKSSSVIHEANYIDDSTIYIGFVQRFYFLENTEIFTELYFNRSINTWEEYDSISKLSERVYRDDENSRSIIPTKVAFENFDLRGLDRVWLYDSGNNQIENELKPKSFEFLDQSISPVFIAVYETAIKHQEISYCIGGINPEFDDLEIQNISEERIISEIEQGFQEHEVLTDHGTRHFQYILNDELILTISNTDLYTFIHMTFEGQTNKIYEVGEPESIVRIQVIPILIEDMPILLCEFVKPDTDLFWSEVLVYNGRRYQKAENQRVRTYRNSNSGR